MSSLGEIAQALAAPLKVYLLSFDQTFGGRAVVQAFLDTRREEVRNWVSNYDNAILLVSRRSLPELREMIHSRFPIGLFMIADVSLQSVDGWMPANIWDFVRDPKAAAPPPSPYGMSLAQALGKDPWKPR